jgi:hypothetical protein
MAKFQNGDKHFAVLSSAADTGISLHASNQAKNQRRRLMITLQVGWSADKAMQMLGRVHRTDQAHPPHYALLVSDMGGEMRFISTIHPAHGVTRRIDQGARRTQPGAVISCPRSTFRASRACRQRKRSTMRCCETRSAGHRPARERNPRQAARSANGTVPPTDRANVNKLLNGLLALEPDIQNQVYQYYFEIFQAAIQAALENNTLDTGVRSLPGDEFFFKEGRTIAKDPQTGATTHYQPVTVRSRIPRLSLAQRDQRIRANAASNPRVVVSSDGKKMALLTDAYPIVHTDGSQSPAVYAARPERGGSNRVDADNYDKWKTPEEFAAQKKTTLEGKVKEHESSLERENKCSPRRKRTRRLAADEPSRAAFKRLRRVSGPVKSTSTRLAADQRPASTMRPPGRRHKRVLRKPKGTRGR